MAVYKRVLLKLSGEALKTGNDLFDFDQVHRAAAVIRKMADMGTQIGIVIGAGNIWRGRQGPAANMDAVTADQMGMLGTVINCLCMADALRQAGVGPDCLKAVLTSHNRSWNALQLYGELLREHQAMNGR